MKRKIAVVTGTRAEYGLLYWIMRGIENSSKLKLQLIVTGMHLSPQFGNTYREIEKDGLNIDKKIDLFISGDTSIAISRSIGLGAMKFGYAYQQLKPDILLVLGDRYEILAAVVAAVAFNLPIAHIAGGEITEGSMDEQIRHAITKMAHIHFPCAYKYAENLRKMGEEKWRIFNIGHPALERIRKTKLIKREKLFKLLNLDPKKKTLLVTLHPATLNIEGKAKKESKIFFDLLKRYKDTNIVITYPNLDKNTKFIIAEIEKLRNFSNIKIFKNLGNLLYLSLMKESNLVLGNSSSGIVESPFFKVPCIDCGDRQKGRLKANNIIHIDLNKKELSQAIEKALYDRSFLKKVKNTKNLYGEGDTSKKIVSVLEEIPLGQKLIRKKLIFNQ